MIHKKYSLFKSTLDCDNKKKQEIAMLKAQHDLEVFGRTINDLDDRLPKGRSRCFDIGIWGGCGSGCAAFVDGECDEPQEIDYIYMVEDHGEDGAKEIKEKYPEGTWDS